MSGEETLLDIARRNLVTAKTMMKLVDADDGYLNVVGYHAQQAIELSIKHYLETHGIKYPMTHDISQLTARIPDDAMEPFEGIENSAANITNMEAKTRYIKNYRLSRRIVEKALRQAEALIAQLQEG
ncbi:HEPN domain-containing protein [Selenomonas sp.]|uniref:HEPN domain-containing protein n=1 Tax=Selenomonas sp. TaxID=2053611 RepID=UPI002A756469|nr:HEPN domain-containing protein [Selenomonas sp.]MDY3296438.1 HEPN domain-containing protein [Selenomonas sp.]